MRKKVVAALAVAAAFAAFSIMATAASAAPVITHPTGTVLATGTLIEGTQLGVSKMTTGSDPGTPVVECSNSTMTGKLTKNNTAEGFEGEITSATFWGTGPVSPHNGLTECTGSFGNLAVTALGLPWCIRSTKTPDAFEVRGGKCSEAAKPITFSLISTTVGTCNYEGGPVSGTFHTHPTDLIATVTHSGGFKKSSGSFLCPGEGNLDMEFTLETDGVANSPLYAST
jgi:hypothetical protein